MKFSNTILLAIFVLVVVILKGVASQEAKHNYADALSKSILFFEGQRSGKLPFTQRMKWRKDSALHDGKDAGMDLTGGYYDAGDNIKFNFPMAFTTTVLAWGIIEYGNLMGSELVHATEAVRWGTDYLLKSTSIPNKVVVQIGDPYSDHTCWQRPEDMDTDRTTFAVTDRNPGSEVAAETAAALASSSIIFQKSDPAYSKLLLQRAIQVFNFADRHRGSFNDSLGHWVCPFYCDFSGYHDELLWAAAWLYKASNQQNYRDYVVKNSNTIYTGQVNALTRSGEFGWDDKHAGIYVLMATDSLMRSTGDSQAFQISADDFICTVLPESPTGGVTYSKGGLMFKTGACNMQHTTALSFLLLTYSRYLAHSSKVVRCGDKIATPQRIVEIVKGQVDYILGSNPMKMSYMVGYGNRYPQKIHHRGSVLPSVDQHPQHLACHDETPYLNSTRPNPNQLTGAVVGGPWPNDTYPDSRYLSELSEPTTYVNAPLVGVLAYFSAQTKN